MSKENNLTDFLTDVADAIREKKGTSEKINPQNFSEEIRGIEGSSPFAVDFGEEIATGNSAFIGALQEDIDYYNEVVRSIEDGERTPDDYLEGELANEFQTRIAWWPVIKGELMKCKTYSFSGYANLVSFEHEDFSFPSYGINSFYNCYSLKMFKGDTSNVETFTRFFEGCYTLVDIGIIDVAKCVNGSNFLNTCYNLRTADVKNLKFNFVLKSTKYLRIESVKYILDHCQAREDGAAYTLTLDATVKQNFLNKCTDGHADYDAEYAASLASANEKGLTLA